MTELSLHILDLVRNALEAGASRVEIVVDEDPATDTLRLEVKDNGRGMSQEEIDRVLDPFYTTRKTRHVGLGLPLLQEACQRCEGELSIRSRPGRGTTVQALFKRSHIDRAPLGDMPSVLLTILFSEKPVDWLYVHRIDGREFRLDTAEVRKETAEVPLTHPRVRQWLLEYLRKGEQDLGSTDIPLRAIA